MATLLMAPYASLYPENPATQNAKRTFSRYFKPPAKKFPNLSDKLGVLGNIPSTRQRRFASCAIVHLYPHPVVL